MNQIKNILHQSILINQEIIPYKLKRSLKAKYIRLQISNSELEVVLPRGLSVKYAEEFILKKAVWIKKHLKYKTPGKETFLLFGKEVKILQTFDFFYKKHKINFNGGVLNIVSPFQSKTEIKSLYDFWLKSYSKKYILNRTAQLADEFNFSVNKIKIRGQKTRWGSCSSKKNLSFNFRLMEFRKEVIDYVIIHELCHLKEMNHSNKFWKLIEKYCPDYKSLKKELKGNLNF